MRNPIRFLATSGALPVILLTAVVQGWALYALHQSIEYSFWPATHWGWLLALYGVTIFVPLTIQLFFEHVKSKALWAVVGVIGLAYFYFGWHHGSSVIADPVGKFPPSDSVFQLAVVGALLWLLVMPFLQVRLSTGDWRTPYSLLFTTAWRNKLMLAEAGLFTVLFWLLLTLWQTLFHMLGINYFKELFAEPSFVYPVTTITFGVALHLIGSIERLTGAILEQLLNVLKWLAIVAGFILAIFSLALVFKLPNLVFFGEKAIGAAWLLWLIAGIVLLLNAAYRDGSIERPYPRWIAFALRCVIPLTVIVAATACYALTIRAQRYGVTVERVWAFVVALTALAYAVGYSVAATRSGSWLRLMGRVNVTVALALIATLAMTLTPVLSPFRLSANSQYRMSLEKGRDESNSQVARSSFQYLRFDAGRYGIEKLRELSTLTDHPDAKHIQALAQAALKSENRWQPNQIDPDDVLSQLKIYPPDHALDEKLRQKLVEEIKKGKIVASYPRRADRILAGIFVDLRDDKQDEFVLLNQFGGRVFQKVGDEWELKGGVVRDDQGPLTWNAFAKDLAADKIRASVSEWKNLEIGAHRFRVTQAREDGGPAFISTVGDD